MKDAKHSDIKAGVPQPLGACARDGGVNFAFLSPHATRVRLELFNKPEDATPARAIDLNLAENRTGDVWHVWIKGISTGQLYACRMDGPYNPKEGQRFNFNKLLVDPFATAISNLPAWDFIPALGYDPSKPDADSVLSTVNNAASSPKCVFTQDNFDWSQDTAPKHPWSKTVIYETHLRGLTINANAKVKAPGTYRGLIEKIPYFKELGVTALELLPVQEFNENQSRRINPQTGQPLVNYWGYDPIVFSAPKASYSSAGGVGQQIQEFKEMVLELHKAGIEVILDVVFNHTAEGDEPGPTLSWRGMNNDIFYMLENDKRFYKNYTGCGNTFNANHPIVQEHILISLRYWAKVMHVDGFRFDLASILARDTNGNLLANAPVLEKIAHDPILKDVKIIAEPWDAAGAYQVGSFSHRRWVEWNDRYRDEVRRFWRGDDGMLGAFASRICGSSDIFAHSGKGPQNSINFITCHDGFTLNDLVSYSTKHNEANGQYNKDGANENLSDNYGVEGPSRDAGVESIRKRQIKNFLLTLFVSRGVPMLLGGDELRRTQAGNNNAYCQDNEMSWYDWDCLKQHKDIFSFTRGMIAFRRAHSILSKEKFYTDDEIKWFSPQGGDVNWTNPWEKQFACLVYEDNAHELFLMFNASGDAGDFNLPSLPAGRRWRIFVDTSCDAPRIENQQTYRLNPKASAIFLT